MKIYILNDYEEHGPESIRASMSPDGIRRAFIERLDADWPAGRNKFDDEYRLQAAARLEELLAADEPCSRDLGVGWGGLQLHIVETSEGAETAKDVNK